jgi:hypothetical protein
MKMKGLCILVLIGMFFCQCKHDVYVPDCVCADLDIISSTQVRNFGTQTGRIIFPNNVRPISNYKIQAEKDFTGYGKTYIVCTDSALIKQIKDKGIVDSSFISLTGIDAFLIGNCNIFAQRSVILFSNPGAIEPLPTIRVKTIDKK